MAAMAPSERAQFLSRVLGYERLRVAQRLVKEQARDRSRRRRRACASAMPDAASIERVHAEASQRLGAGRGARDVGGVASRPGATACSPTWRRAGCAAQREREQLQEALARAARRRERGGVVRARRGAHRARARRDGRRPRRSSSDSARSWRRSAPLSEELQTLDQLAREEGRRQALLETERALEEEVRRLRERRVKHRDRARARGGGRRSSWSSAARMLELVQGELEAKRTEWVRDRQEAETKHVALRQQYAEVKEKRERLVALGEDGSVRSASARSTITIARCSITSTSSSTRSWPTASTTSRASSSSRRCRRRSASSTSGVARPSRTSASSSAGSPRCSSRCRSSGSSRASSTAKEQRFDAGAQATARRSPAATTPARHAAARRELERLRPLDARATRLATQLERRPVLIVGARSRRRRRSPRRRDASPRSPRAATCSRFSEQSFAELRATHDAAAAELRAAELDAVAATGEASAAQAAVDARRAGARWSSRAAKGKLDALDRQKRLHDELDRAYTDLRTDLNVQLRPEMSELASAFLTELTDARYDELELDDSYNLTVLEDGVPKPVISGGEQDVANLVPPSRHLADDRRARRPELLAADPRRGVRLARRGAPAERRGAAARAAGPLRAGHPHHAHRVGARGAGSRRSACATTRRRARRVVTQTESGVLDGELLAGAWRSADGRRSRSWRALAARGGAVHRARRGDRRAERACSATRSPSATAATAWSACACRTSTRRSGATRSRTPPAARWCGATRAAGSPAFNMVHRSGVEGWMGPLAVRTEHQGSGLGKEIVERGVAWLETRGRARDRARDDAAHDGQHRLLLAARLRARPAHDHPDARCGVGATADPSCWGA